MNTTDPVKIPYGSKQVYGQLQKGDAIWDGERWRKVKKGYPFVGLTRLVAIRRCTVTQTELPMEAALPLDE